MVITATHLEGKNVTRVRNARRKARGAVTRSRELDAIDRGIIEALQRNGRESFRRIGRELGVSEATVRARYNRLSADSILQVIGVTNPLGLGFGAMAMVGVRTAGAPEPVAEEIGGWEEADYVVVTAGQFDLLVEVVCTDKRGLLEVTNRMRSLDGVVSTESFMYLELHKQLYNWGVPGLDHRWQATSNAARRGSS